MIGVILAAGRATRLYPVTKEVSKMVLPVYDKPVIYYSINALMFSGIKKILIICRGTHLKQIRSVLTDIPEFKGVSINFKVKNHDLGMPFSIFQAKQFAKQEPIIIMPGDNIYLQNYKKEIDNFTSGAVVHLTKVKDPQRSGTIVLKNKKIIDLVEKPENPQTKFALTAPYMFDSKVYKYIKTLKPSKRGELEITELLKIYFKEGKLKFPKTTGYWQDIGTFEALLETGNYLKKYFKKSSRV